MTNLDEQIKKELKRIKEAKKPVFHDTQEEKRLIISAQDRMNTGWYNLKVNLNKLEKDHTDTIKKLKKLYDQFTEIVDDITSNELKKK